MPKKKSQGKKGNRKLGRSVDKCKRYRDRHTREKNKVRRILKSSGRAEAERYAVTNGVVGYLASILQK